jgi:hypothetical protein
MVEIYTDIIQEARSSHGDRKATENLLKDAIKRGLVDVEQKKSGHMVKSLVDDSQYLIHGGERDYHHLRRYIQKLENLNKNNFREDTLKHDNDKTVVKEMTFNEMYNFFLEKTKPKKKKKSKLRSKCQAKAKAKYDVWPSAYASGYVQKCVKRKGVIEQTSTETPQETLSENLRDWFAPHVDKKGKKFKGWINCKTGGPCGRKDTSKGSYPACRPTKAQCKKIKGKMYKKKSSKRVNWKK